MEGEGMVAVVRGLRDAGLAVTLLDGSRQYTLLPNSSKNLVQKSGDRSAVINSNAATATQFSQKHTVDSSTESANLQCDRDAQAVDGRYTSTYKTMHCNMRPTSPPIQLAEFPPQKPDLQPGHGNFQVGGSGSGATGSSIRATSPSNSFRGAMSWPDRGSVCTPRPSLEIDAFANSLRKYPCVSPDRSSEIMERLVNYTQAKGLTKPRNPSSPTRYAEQTSHHTLEPKTSRLSRSYEPEITLRAKKNEDAPTRDRKNEHHDRISRNFDMRYLREMSKRFKDTKGTVYPYTQPVCPTIRESHDYQQYSSDLHTSSNSANMEIQAAVKMISKEVSTMHQDLQSSKTVAVPGSTALSTTEDNAEGDCFFTPNLDTNTSRKSIQTTFSISEINLKPRKSAQTICSTLDVNRRHSKLIVSRKTKSQEVLKVTKNELKRSLLELIQEVSNAEKSRNIIREELVNRLFDTNGDNKDNKSVSANSRRDKCDKYVSTFSPSGCDYVGDFHELLGQLKHCYGNTKQIYRSEVKPFRISEYRQLDYILKDWINNFNAKIIGVDKYVERTEILSDVEDKIKQLFKDRTKQDFDLKTGIVNILQEIPMEVSYNKSMYLHKLVDLLLMRMKNVVMRKQNGYTMRKVPINRSHKVLTEGDIRDFLRTHLFDLFNEFNIEISINTLNELENELIDVMIDSIDCIRCGHIDDASEEMEFVLQDLGQVSNKKANYISQMILQDFYDILNNCNFTKTYMILHSNVNDSEQSTSAANDASLSIGAITEEDLNANLDQYTNQLCQQINEWLDSLDIPQSHDKSFREVVVNDLAEDIIDRHKYIELHPNVRNTEEDELETLKYQIFKWVNKLVGEENQETLGNAPQLMRKINGVPVPMLINPMRKQMDQKKPFDPMRPYVGETGPNTYAEENLKLRPPLIGSCCNKNPNTKTCCHKKSGPCCTKETCKNLKTKAKKTESQSSNQPAQTSQGHKDPQSQIPQSAQEPESYFPVDQRSGNTSPGQVPKTQFALGQTPIGRESPIAQATQEDIVHHGPSLPKGQLSPHSQPPLGGSGYSGSNSPTKQITKEHGSTGPGSPYSKVPPNSQNNSGYNLPPGHVSPISQGVPDNVETYRYANQVSPYSYTAHESEAGRAPGSPAEQSNQVSSGPYDLGGQHFTTDPYGQYPSHAVGSLGPNYQNTTLGSEARPGIQNVQSEKSPYSQGQSFGPPAGQSTPISMMDPNKQWNSPAAFSPKIHSSPLHDPASVQGHGIPISGKMSPDGKPGLRHPDMGPPVNDLSQSMYGTESESSVGPQRFAMAADPMHGKASTSYSQQSSQIPSSAKRTYQDTLGPVPPSLKQINDDYDEYLKQWVLQIPIPENKPSEEESAEKARLDMYNGVWKGVTKMKLDPDIFNDPYNYQDVFNDELEALFKKIPKSKQLEDTKEMLKDQLLQKTIAVNAQIRSTNAPASYKQQLIETIEYNLPKRTHTVNEADPIQQQEEVEKMKLAEYHILYTRYKDEDNFKGNVYQQNFLKKLGELLDAIRVKNGIDIEPNAYANDIISALDKVPVPDMNYMRDEADDILLGIEVEKWISDLLMEPDNTLPLEKRRLRDSISKKIQEIGSKVGYGDDSFTRLLKIEVPKYLEKMPIQEDANVDFMIEELANRIRNLLKYIRPKAVSFGDSLDYDEFSKNMPASSSYTEQPGSKSWGSQKDSTPNDNQWHSLQKTMVPQGLLNWTHGPTSMSPQMTPGGGREVRNPHPLSEKQGGKDDQWHSLQKTTVPQGLFNWTHGPQSLSPQMSTPGRGHEVRHPHPISSSGKQGGIYNPQGTQACDMSPKSPCCTNSACTNSHSLPQGLQEPQGPYSHTGPYDRVPYDQGTPMMQGSQIPFTPNVQSSQIPQYQNPNTSYRGPSETARGQGLLNFQGISTPGSHMPPYIHQMQPGYFGQPAQNAQFDPHTGQAIPSAPPEYHQPLYTDASAEVKSNMQTSRQNQTAQSFGPVSAATQFPERTDPLQRVNMQEMAGGGLGVLGISQEQGPSTRNTSNRATQPYQSHSHSATGIPPSTAVATDNPQDLYQSTDRKDVGLVTEPNENQRFKTCRPQPARSCTPRWPMCRAYPPRKKCQGWPKFTSDGFRKILEIDETDNENSTDKDSDDCQYRRPRRCWTKSGNNCEPCDPIVRRPYHQLINYNCRIVPKDKTTEVKTTTKKPFDLSEKEIFNIKSVQTASSTIDIHTTKCKYCEIRSKSQEELTTRITKKQEIIRRKDQGRGDLQDDVTEWFEIHSDKVKVKLWGEKMQKLVEKLKKPGGEEKLRIKIEKYLKKVPEQFSEGDDENLGFRKRIPNDIIRQLKKLYLHPPDNKLSLGKMELTKYGSRYKMDTFRKIILNWVKNINIKKKDFLGRNVKKDDISKYIADKLEPIVFDRPKLDLEFKIALKSNIKDLIDELPLAVGSQDKERYINKVTDALVTDILNIGSKVPSTYIQPTIKEIKEFVKDEITFFLEKSRVAISTKRMEYLESELVDLLLDLTDVVDIDSYVVEDVTTILKEIGKLPEYKAKYFTNLLLRDYKEFFFRESFFNERSNSDYLPIAFSVFQNTHGLVDSNVESSFDVYKQQIVEEITTWLSKMNISNKENTEILIKDLASNIVNRHKYIILNSNTKLTHAEEEDSLKCQISKWLNTIVDDQNTIVLEHTQELTNIINNIPKPLYPSFGNIQFMSLQNIDIGNDIKLYIEILIQEIYDWFHELPMDLQMYQDRKLNTQLIRDLAEVIEKGLAKKDPEVITREVGKWTEKIFDSKLNRNYLEKLKHRIKSVPYINENLEKDPKQEKVLIRSYEDIIDVWLDSIAMEPTKEGHFINSRNEIIHNLAVNICHMKSRLINMSIEAIERKLQEKITNWMKKLPILVEKQNNRHKYAEKLVKSIQECDINDSVDRQSLQTNQESVIDQLEGVILEWLKKNINLENEEYQEEVMKEIANKIDAAICNRLSYPYEDIIEYIKMLIPGQSDEYIQSTASKLKVYLQEHNMLGDSQPRDAEDDIIINNIEAWLNSLPLAAADSNSFESQKVDFIESLIRIKSSDKAVLKKEILTFMKTLPIESYKKGDKQYLDKEASKLIVSLSVEPDVNIQNKSPLKSNAIISNVIRDWTNTLPLKLIYCPGELRSFIEDMSLVLTTLVLDPEYRVSKESDAKLHREITKFLRRFPLQEVYNSDSQVSHMAEELIRTLKDVNLFKDRRIPLVNSYTVYGVSLQNSNNTDDFSIPSIQESDINANLNTYTRKLITQIGIWFDNLNLPSTTKESLKEVVINDLAGDIVDRHKYLELNPDYKVSEEDELEHLKYQIFKWINKLVGEENLETIAHADDLMNRVQEIPVPMLVKPQDKRQTLNSAGGGYKTRNKSAREPSSQEGESILEDASERSKLPKEVNPLETSASPAEVSPPSGVGLSESLSIPLSPQSSYYSRKGHPTIENIPTPTKCCSHQIPYLPPPDEGTKEAIYDKYQKIFRAKCNDLPIDASTPENAKLAELAKTGIYNGIVKTFFRLKSDPDIENDYGYFEFMLEEKIEEMLDILPQTEELKNKRHAWKLDILANAIDMLDQLHSLSDRPSFRQRVRNKFNRKFARDLELEECFLLQQGFLAEVADAYILESNYKEKNPILANIYRNRLIKKVDDLANHLAQEHNVGFRFFKKAQLARIAMKVLEQVPIPKEDILQGEAEEIRLADEVEKWYNELPTKPFVNDTDAVLRKRMMDLLAKKLYDIHKHAKDTSKENKMKHEISLFLEKRAQLQDDQDLNINFMVDELNNRLKNNWLQEPLDYNAFEKAKPLSSTFAQVSNRDFLTPLMDAAINTTPMPGQDYRGYVDQGYFAQPRPVSPKTTYGGNNNKNIMGPTQRYISNAHQGSSSPSTSTYTNNKNWNHQVPNQSTPKNPRPLLYDSGVVLNQAGPSDRCDSQQSPNLRMHGPQLGSNRVGPKRDPITLVSHPISNASQTCSSPYGTQFGGNHVGRDQIYMTQQGLPMPSLGNTSPKNTQEAVRSSPVAPSPRTQNNAQNPKENFVGQIQPGLFFDPNIPGAYKSQAPYSNYSTQGGVGSGGVPQGKTDPLAEEEELIEGDYRIRCRCLEAYRKRRRCFECDDRYSRFKPYKCPY